MVRIFCIAPLALAAVSAVSGHVIRHKKPPPGWETNILQNYDAYHDRYLQWNCQDQHNTTFFDKCCHPLLKGESINNLDVLGCKAPDDECDDGGSSVPPSSTPSNSSHPAEVKAPPQPSSSPSSKPPSGALGKTNDTPSSPPTTPSSTPVTTTQSPTSSPHPAPTSGSGGGGGGDVHKGGEATFFFQHNTAGACGTVHQDSDFICAIDSALFSQAICGKSVHVTNTDNGHTVTVIVADECPTCTGPNSIDFSTGAFNQLGDPSKGVLPIEWSFDD